MGDLLFGLCRLANQLGIDLEDGFLQTKEKVFTKYDKKGDETNIGAGTITANFDGQRKHRTKIGKKVLIGSDTVFVAPVEISHGARTGAGSVVTHGTKVKKGEVIAGVPARRLKRTKKK